MQWFRTLSGFVRLLVPLFLLAQLAGVVAAPEVAHGHSAIAAAHEHSTSDAAHPGLLHQHGDHNTDPADHCCALHAFFAGVIPPAIAVEKVDVTARLLNSALSDVVTGIASGRLDRPPKRLLAA